MLALYKYLLKDFKAVQKPSNAIKGFHASKEFIMIRKLFTKSTKSVLVIIKILHHRAQPRYFSGEESAENKESVESGESVENISEHGECVENISGRV